MDLKISKYFSQDITTRFGFDEGLVLRDFNYVYNCVKSSKIFNSVIGTETNAQIELKSFYANLFHSDKFRNFTVRDVNYNTALITLIWAPFLYDLYNSFYSLPPHTFESHNPSPKTNHHDKN